MDEREHRVIARWERRWLAASAVISVMFVILIAYNLAVEGAHIAQQSDRAEPSEILSNDLFANPGVVQLDQPPDASTLDALRQPIPGPHTDRLCAIAARTGLWLVPGSLYERSGNSVYNTALALSPEGEIVARYRKMFPWYSYEAKASAGTEFCVFDIPSVGRSGPSICYDMWFPETVRALTWMGAEVILQPTLTTTSDRSLELVISQASAITNQCYFIDVNGVDPWGGGSSVLVDPDGRVLQTAGTGQAVLTELLDLDRVKRVREFGNLGLTQTLKQLRDAGVRFPQHGGDFGDGEVFRDLGQLGHSDRVVRDT